MIPESTLLLEACEVGQPEVGDEGDEQAGPVAASAAQCASPSHHISIVKSSGVPTGRPRRRRGRSRPAPSCQAATQSRSTDGTLGQFTPGFPRLSTPGCRRTLLAGRVHYRCSDHTDGRTTRYHYRQRVQRGRWMWGRQERRFAAFWGGRAGRISCRADSVDRAAARSARIRCRAPTTWPCSDRHS